MGPNRTHVDNVYVFEAGKSQILQDLASKTTRAAVVLVRNGSTVSRTWEDLHDPVKAYQW